MAVYCRTGGWSSEVAEILAERGYDVSDPEGGWKAYQTLIDSAAPVELGGVSTFLGAGEKSDMSLFI